METPGSAGAPGAEPARPGSPGGAEPGSAEHPARNPASPAPEHPARSPAARRPPARPQGPARQAPPPRPAAAINLTIPLTTLLGLTDHPGEAAGYGPIDAGLARTLATQATGNPATTWCITITDTDGHPTAHGCATPRPAANPRAKTRRRHPAPHRHRHADGGPPGTGTRHRSGPPGTGRTAAPGTGSGPPGGYGTWRLQLPGGGPALTARPEPLAVTECDHRHQTPAHDPGRALRHLVHIRDGHCTYPPCLRDARRCDFEHTIPWETGGRTCACNTGPLRLR